MATPRRGVLALAYLVVLTLAVGVPELVHLHGSTGSTPVGVSRAQPYQVGGVQFDDEPDLSV
jgi:hypothetical protein